MIALMNKKTRLFVLLALVAGGVVGYAGSLLDSPSIVNDEKQVDSAVTARPRFGDAHLISSTVALRQQSPSRSNKSEMAKLDDTLQQYSRMSTEELWGELEILSKQKDEYIYSPNTMREVLMSYIFNRLGQEAPRQTLGMMKDEKSIFRNYKHAVLEAWGEKNPEAAMAYCRENMESDTENSREWKRIYLSLLSDSSQEKAVDYLLALSPKECADYSENVLFEIACKTPEKMTKLMEKLAPAMKRRRWVDELIAVQWAQSDWSAAEQWIKTLPEKSRSEIMGKAVGALPREEALKKLSTLDEKGKLEALIQLSGALSRGAQTEALDMVLNNTTEEQAVKLFERGFHFFNFRDSEVNSYLNKMPAGTVKDSILEKAIQNQFANGSNACFFNPKIEDAFPLIDQISSPSKKEETIDFTLNQWVYREPQKVKSWVEQSHLSDEKKSQFSKQCDSIIKSKKEG